MRKQRDFDAELTALNATVKQLKDLKLVQLGELVIATGADALPIDQLSGALLAAVEMRDSATTEGWRQRGAAFFRKSREARDNAVSKSRRVAPRDCGLPPSAGSSGAK